MKKLFQILFFRHKQNGHMPSSQQSKSTIERLRKTADKLSKLRATIEQHYENLKNTNGSLR